MALALRRRIRRALKPDGPEEPAQALDVLSHLSDADRSIVERALPHTMTGPSRLVALVDAVRYCVRRDLRGAFVECGVWRGGSVLALILTLQDLGVSDRDIYLYDTFEGMTAPTEHDVSSLDPPALATWRAAERRGEKPWNDMFDSSRFNEDDVRQRVLSSGYPSERLHLVRGKVEDTLPAVMPEAIALLRLDTDWYESTRHELEHLYPRLASAGVLIIDDYGHWDGARRAVDEYFASHGPAPLLNRIDYTGRITTKI